MGDRIAKMSIPEPNSGCWLWLGRVNQWGYGLIKINKRGQRAHRESYRHFVGQIEPGLFVCHKCDVPSCVNPAHLYAGTPAQNSADMMRRGRTPKTRKGSTRVHLPMSVAEARKAVIQAANLPPHVIAVAFGMEDRMVRRIKRNETWVHVEPAT